MNIIEMVTDPINGFNKTKKLKIGDKKFSQIRVTNKKGIIKIGKFIYDDMVVLKRKYNSWESSISKFR